MSKLELEIEIINTELQNLKHNNDEKLIKMALTALRLPKKLISLQPESNIKLKEITLDEVSYHDHYNDCWIIIYDRVYDVTKFLKQHPGGYDVILDYAGRDASLAFSGTGHSEAALKGLKLYQIGELPLKERIFRCLNGLKLPNLPD